MPRQSGAPEETRTPNLLIRSQMLYPIELRAQLRYLKRHRPFTRPYRETQELIIKKI